MRCGEPVTRRAVDVSKIVICLFDDTDGNRDSRMRNKLARAFREITRNEKQKQKNRPSTPSLTRRRDQIRQVESSTFR